MKIIVICLFLRHFLQFLYEITPLKSYRFYPERMGLVYKASNVTTSENPCKKTL